MNSSNFRVLHIIDSGGLYGAEVMLLNLIAEQVKIGLKPTIASIGDSNIDEKLFESEAMKRGFNLRKFRMHPGPNFLGAMEILKFMNKQGFDLMHSHGYKGNIFFGLMPRKIRKYPIISTLHGWTSTTGISKLKIYEWLDSFSLNFIDAIVLVNKEMQSNPKLINRKKINLRIINNGIPITVKKKNESLNVPSGFAHPKPSHTTQQTQFASNLDPKIINFCKNGFTIGSIGRLSAEKGYNFLIEALALLTKNGIDAHLIAIGEGGERKYLEGLVSKYELSDRVQMPGYREDAKQYIPFFNVYAISSLTEGLPITILEAMQAKVPIVASKVGGIPNALQDGIAGLLVKPCQPDALAESISQIFHNKELAGELKNIAFKRVCSHYSSKVMASKYLDIYNELIRN